MAEAEVIEPNPEPIPAPEPEPTPTPEPEPEPTPDDDREPGGTEGAAVYARRKNREAKAARDAFEVEREARIRLEEQLAAAKQQNEKVVEKPVFTPEEVWAEVAAGRLDTNKAKEYLETTKQTVKDQVRAALREEIDRTRPIETAVGKLNEYRELVDWANDRTHPNFLKAQQRFQVLVSRGSPANEATELTAMEDVAGDLETIRRKNEMRTVTRAAANPAPANVSNGGGNGGPRVTDVTSKVPKHLIDGWKSMGITDDATLKKYAQHHLDKMDRRRGMMGG